MSITSHTKRFLQNAKMKNIANKTTIRIILIFLLSSCSDGNLTEKRLAQIEDSARIMNEIIETQKGSLGEHAKIQQPAETEIATISKNEETASLTDEEIMSNTNSTKIIEDFLETKKQYHELIALAYDKAKSTYLYTGEGNFPRLSQEIKNQYPQKIRELETFYIQNKRSFNNELFKEYQNLKIKMQNLFQDAFQTL